MKSIFLIIVISLIGLEYAQSQSDTLFVEKRKRLIDSLTYETQTGLPIAASKIYFTDSKFTFSGFGETNFVNYRGPKNVESNDVELYYTNLQRLVAYAAWKPKKWLVLYGEFFAEFLNDGNNESHFEYLPELFVDFLIDEKFNVRVGTHQPGIGFINNNDEPIMFFTVNRPEVERLIIPSQWIDLGIMTYGKISDDLKWNLSLYQGLDANNLNGSTWLRRGRDEALRFNFSSYVLNSKFVYTGMKDTEISASGIWTRLGDSQQINTNDGLERVRASTLLLSSYVRHVYRDWTFMVLGTYGRINDTDKLYELTRSSDLGPQVLGEQVYGVYGEVSYDILPALGWNKPGPSRDKDNLFIRRNEFKLPLFVRMERLNTHAGVHDQLAHLARSQTDLTTLTMGLNFNPRRNMVLKSNYQIRWNDRPMENGEYEGNRFEMGLGFIF
ncbi:hypothetical protein [Negadavirga shengliensis]|uniref:Phosphate-selective porin O and P n=1 Tax=Negadavirga shengliensis TaxID=1389218 RepID=A0ABV9SZN2_9BACT